MKSQDIIKALRGRFSHNPLYIIEAFVFKEESDFLIITREDYTHEIEIKISRSDFLADFKKTKHRRFEAILENKEMITIRGQERNKTCEIPMYYADSYYGRIRGHRNQKIWMCDVWFRKVSKSDVPNKFSFACPEGLIKKEELPSHYGLYYVNDSGLIREVKRAKFVHKEKFSNWKHLASKFFWHTVNLRDSIHRLKYQLKQKQ